MVKSLFLIVCLSTMAFVWVLVIIIWNPNNYGLFFGMSNYVIWFILLGIHHIRYHIFNHRYIYNLKHLDNLFFYAH